MSGDTHSNKRSLVHFQKNHQNMSSSTKSINKPPASHSSLIDHRNMHIETLASRGHTHGDQMQPDEATMGDPNHHHQFGGLNEQLNSYEMLE